MRHSRFFKIGLALGALCLAGALLAVSIPTGRFDNSRTAWNSGELTLTQAVVQVPQAVGLVASYTVDDAVYGQPIYVPSINVTGVGVRNLLIAATMNCSVYAFDADDNGGAALWSHTGLCTPWQFPNYPHIDGSPLEYGGQIGCTATPAADSTYVYVSCATSTPSWKVFKLSLVDGATSTSVTVSGTCTGTAFAASQHMQRTGLTIANSKLYIGYSSQSDIATYHGFLFALNTSDLSTAACFCTTPGGNGGGIWNGGSGLSVAANGDLIVTTGNGDFNGTTQFAQSILRLDGSTLALVDWYTPTDWASMNSIDSDLGSGPAILIPGSTKIVTGAKDYRIFSVDSACMGHLGGSVGGCGPAQVFATNGSGTITDHSGVYNGLFLNAAGYFPNTNGKIYKFAFTSNSFNTTPTTSSASYEFPGAQMAASSNGASNGIIWATTVSSSALYSAVAGTLLALNPSDMSVYWSSDTNVNDALGTMAKFAPPLIANGRVYVSTLSNRIKAYGVHYSSIDGGTGTTGGATTAQ